MYYNSHSSLTIWLFVALLYPCHRVGGSQDSGEVVLKDTEIKYAWV